MRKKANPTANAGGVQVFHLTMNNTEDQDELNRRLRKPGEPVPESSSKDGLAGHGESAAEPTGKKTPKRKRNS
jgi:hypothetical protein